MPHEFSRAFQQAVRIGQLRSLKESDVDMRGKRIDITKCGFTHTGCWMIVMKQLTYIIAARSHDLEPQPGERSESIGSSVEPQLDRGIASHCSWKLKKPLPDHF